MTWLLLVQAAMAWLLPTTSPRNTGITSVAVLEKGRLGGGSVGRNTTIVRSNYLWDESAHLYEKSLKMWETLSQDLNYNVMFSQRGVLNLGDAEILTADQVRATCPIISKTPVRRSFAEYLALWLKDAAQEYGLVISQPLASSLSEAVLHSQDIAAPGAARARGHSTPLGAADDVPNGSR
jgi:hypothetical protein